MSAIGAKRTLADWRKHTPCPEPADLVADRGSIPAVTAMVLCKECQRKHGPIVGTHTHQPGRMQSVHNAVIARIDKLRQLRGNSIGRNQRQLWITNATR